MDCGFATFAGSDGVHESIVWAKLAEGARIASKQLWAKRSATPAKAKAKAAKKAKAASKTKAKAVAKVRTKARVGKRR